MLDLSLFHLFLKLFTERSTCEVKKSEFRQHFTFIKTKKCEKRRKIKTHFSHQARSHVKLSTNSVPSSASVEFLFVQIIAIIPAFDNMCIFLDDPNQLKAFKIGEINSSASPELSSLFGHSHRIEHLRTIQLSISVKLKSVLLIL